MPDDVICKRIRLKPGSLDRVYEWARTLNERREEALATLREESVTIESAFLERAADGDFLIYYMRANGIGAAGAVAAQSTHDIDAYHKAFKRDTWEDRVTLEPLIDLSIE